MKVILFIFVFSMAAIASGALDDAKDVANKAGVSVACGQRILTKAEARCNLQSKAAKDSGRAHDCFYNYDESGPGINKDSVNVVFLVGDADAWSYQVDVSNKVFCKFTVTDMN